MKSMRTRRFAIGLLFGLVCFAAAATGQTETGTISGVVTDEAAAVVPNCDVVLQSVERGTATTGRTNDAGIYVFPNVQPGQYNLTVKRNGFKQVDFLGLIVNVQDHIEQNFRLQVGSVSESVTVEASSLNINTTDASVSTVIDHQFVENLPLNGRSFQQLITLAPGVNLIGASGSTGTQPYGEFTTNGQRATTNYFTVDGVSANIGIAPALGYGVSISGTGNAAGGSNAMVSVDALQEFRILTSSFPPEYGRTPGGQVILLTRSGTNQFHGSVYEYFRNTVFDANDWFANQAGKPRSPLQFNDFGGTLGGPIRKDKTFFFFSYEGQRLNEPQFAATSVPDLASRSAANPATQFILNAFPLPNGSELGDGLAQYAAGFSNPINTSATSFRLDHKFNDKVSAFARYSYAPSNSVTRQPSNNLANATVDSQVAQTLTGGATLIVTPRSTNELRLNWSDNSLTSIARQDSFGGAKTPPSSALFVPPVSAIDANAGVFTNWALIIEGKIFDLEQRQINLSDGFSQTVGSHQLKVGLDYLRQLPINAGPNEDLYFFTDVPSLVKNSMSGATFYGISRLHSDVTDLSFYAQDAWHISSKLALTYGLRWDFNPPPHSRYPNNQDYLAPSVDPAGNIHFGKPGSAYWNTRYTNFGPRLGVAYTIRNASGRETVVRGGIGLFYDLGTEAAPNNGWNNYPTLVSAVPSVSSFPVTPEQFTPPPVDLVNPPPFSIFTSWAKNFSSPRTWEWNVSLQQALGSLQTLTVSYVGAVGRDLVFGQSYTNVGPQGYYLTFYNSAGTSDYNSLQVQYQRRVNRGLNATLAYTFAHSIDTNSDNITANSIPTSVIGANSNRGPSDFDIRHSFSGALSYSLPSYSNGRWLAALSSGWGLDAIITARSALPVDIVDQILVAALGGNYYLRPNLVPGVPRYLASATVPGGRVINAAAFTPDPNGNGDLARNAFRGFDLVETDLSARRSFRLSERFSLLFRADLFNLFNHPNFASPQSNLGRPFFGQSLAMANAFVGGSGSATSGGNSALNSAFQTGGPRTAQLSLKVQF